MSSTDLRTAIPGYVAGDWTIDTVHTHIGFVIKHMMVSKVRGHFTRFDGQITTSADPLEGAVTVTIDVDSIDTNNDMRDDHIRSADFFDAANHPTITFASTGVRAEGERFLIDGDLTIRGISRQVTLRTETPEFGGDGQGGAKAGFSATTELNRHDFGVSYNGPIPGGGVALGDRVQIILDIEADLVAAK